MSDSEVVRLKAEILLMKWHHLYKYLKKDETTRIQRQLISDIELGLEELAGKKIQKLIPAETIKE